MDLKNIKTTDLWDLYEQGKAYQSMKNVYAETDKNYRFYNGNQWQGLKISGIEPVQLNFIKPIVKYKVGNINSNQWAINYSSENIENEDFKETARKTCEMLNKKASKIWETNSMDTIIRKVSKDSAINGEGIVYCDYDEEEEMPIVEVLSKNDIYFGNENDSDIQSQPYIIIKKRMPVLTLQEYARDNGVSEDKMDLIKGDNNTYEESGEDAKYEKDDMATMLIKMYKEKGTVHFEAATKYVRILKDEDAGTKLYPLEHFIWEEKEGSARGEGEVKHLIPNQIEVNKTLMRELITVKTTAYPTRVVNVDKIANPGDAGKVGAVLRTKNGMTVEDVSKAVGIIHPAQMSGDVSKLQQDMISLSRELAGAGDIATGSVNPEDASGRAILAVQQANQQPLIEQLTSLKAFIEGVARIWLDLIITYSTDGITLEDETKDEITGEEQTEPVRVPQSVLLQLQATVKVDITPKGAYDKFAQESSLENMFKAGMFNVEKLPELKVYVKLLDDDSVMPKQKLKEAIEYIEAEQQKIAQINAQAQMLQQQASQYINGDPESQASMTMDQLRQQQVEEPVEEEVVEE
nr:MAG TPA: portal protein [Bacteriophage sp.]